jgi:AcrR family transcriptional regulator
MNVKARQSEETRAKLVRVARDLFARRGYNDVSTEEIVRRAGVTRGALYHHFRDKRDLFQAVVEEIEQEVMQKVAETALAMDDPWEQQTAAPSVLGLAVWREIEAKYGLALVESGLRTVMDSGYIEKQPVEPLAHLLLGALTEGGLLIGRSEDRQAARREVGEGLSRILQGLRTR